MNSDGCNSFPPYARVILVNHLVIEFSLSNSQLGRLTGVKLITLINKSLRRPYGHLINSNTKQVPDIFSHTVLQVPWLCYKVLWTIPPSSLVLRFHKHSTIINVQWFPSPRGWRPPLFLLDSFPPTCCQPLSPSETSFAWTLTCFTP